MTAIEERDHFMCDICSCSFVLNDRMKSKQTARVDTHLKSREKLTFAESAIASSQRWNEWQEGKCMLHIDNGIAYRCHQSATSTKVLHAIQRDFSKEA